MKKTLLASLILTGALSLSAQESKRAQIDPALAGQKAINKKIVVGAESFDQSLLYKKDVNPTVKSVELTEYYVVTEEVIGESFYDLQTNASVQNRLIMKDGSFSAVWTQSKETNTTYSDRGTGYNHNDGSGWGDLPDSRVESERTGWPSIDYLGNGEVMVSHTLDGFSKIITRSVVGSGDWSEDNIGNEVDGDIEHVWHRMKVGGADGQSIHVIANPNQTEEGSTTSIDYISYSRSTDGGASWDILADTLDQIKPEFYTGFSGDNYAIDTNGDNVAFVLGGGDKDVILMKSTDNGDTWEKTVVLEFPVPLFKEDETLIDADTPGAINVNEGIDGADEVWAIETADGAYSLSIDDAGNCHVFYGNYRIANDDLSDGSTSYFPITDGLMYWSEATGTTTDIAGVIDLGGDETLNVESADRIATYFTSLTSFPYSSIAADGTIYLTYSGIIDMISDEQADSGDEYNRHYRHQYLMRSTDGGANWSEPIDLMAEPADPENGDPFMEGVYGNVLADGDNAYILYQRDDQPGVGVRPDTGNPHGITENQMIFATVSLDRFNNISVDENDEDAIVTTAYPNPAKDFVTIQANVTADAEVSLHMVNTLGQTVYSEVKDGNTFNVNLSGMKAGVYFYTIASDNFSTTSKLIIK